MRASFLEIEMRPISKPYSQLILFSNSFEPMIDHWFSGSVIIELKLSSDLENFSEVEAAKSILAEFNETYDKATVIANPRESAVTMSKLCGRFLASVHIVGSQGYKSFDSYTTCVKKYFMLRNFVAASRSCAISMKRFSNFKVEKTYLDYKPSKGLKSLLNAHMQHEQTLRRVLNTPFK
jgi:hypothetical protein